MRKEPKRKVLQNVTSYSNIIRSTPVIKKKKSDPVSGYHSYKNNWQKTKFLKNGGDKKEGRTYKELQTRLKTPYDPYEIETDKLWFINNTPTPTTD